MSCTDTDEGLKTLSEMGSINENNLNEFLYQAQLRETLMQADADFMLPPQALMRRIIVTENPERRKQLRAALALKGEAEAIRATVRKLHNARAKRQVFTESGVATKLGSEGAPKAVDSKQTVTDVVGDTAEQDSAGHSINSQQGQKNLLYIQDFFARPVEIYSTTMAYATDISIALDVWQLYLAIPSVRAKLRNYAYLRGNLYVRVAISGTPFDAGRVLLSYQPYADFNGVLTAVMTSVYRGMKIAYLSQATGSCVINVCDNKPVDYKCPYISPNPMIRLFETNSVALPDSSPFGDEQDIGRMYIYTINQIVNSASTASEGLSLQVYAWMEDVQLGTPTGTVITITTESGTVEERTVGPVQRIASSIVDVSKAVGTVGFLQPYAKASEMIFGAVGYVASLFGWSKPVLIENIQGLHQLPLGHNCQLIGNEVAQRLVMDPKQELSLAPHLLASDVDELIIQNIAKKWAYIGTFTWASTDAVYSVLYSNKVSPALSYYDAAPSNQIEILPSPMYFAANLFAYWRGSIKFRIEVVCNAFCRGKIMVLYEPNCWQYSLVTTDVDLNKNYIKIIDIQQTQTFEFTVNWASHRAWRKVPQYAGARYFIDRSQVANGLSTYPGYDNGFIAIMPFTKLQCPDTADDVRVNVYVCCEDLQVNGPTPNGVAPNRTVLTESGLCVPVEVPHFDLNPSTADTKNICHEHFGEQPLSLRALLKRYTTIELADFSPASQGAHEYQRPIYPANTMRVGSTWTRFSLLSYLRDAYLGMRGSVRYRIHTSAPIALRPLSTARATLFTPGLSDATTVSTITQANESYFTGTVAVVPTTSGGLTFEVPNYNPNLWFFSCNGATLAPSTLIDWFEQFYYRNFLVSFETPTNTVTNGLAIDFATGEDFDLIRFLGTIPCRCTL